MNTECTLYPQHLQRAAPTFHTQAFLIHEVERRLLERLAYTAIQPKCILDAAAKTGQARRLLAKQYPKATILSCEIEIELLQQIRSRIPWRQPVRLCSDYTALPLIDDAVELAVANLSLPFVRDLRNQLAEWKRVIVPGGALFFSTFGPDTFKELSSECANRFIDMHDIGDLLLQLGFENPVVDMEYLTLEYNSKDKLHSDLKHNALQSLMPGEAIKVAPDYFSTTVEIIYGHAWLPKQKQLQQTRNEFNEVLIPVEQLLTSKR